MAPGTAVFFVAYTVVAPLSTDVATSGLKAAERPLSEDASGAQAAQALTNAQVGSVS